MRKVNQITWDLVKKQFDIQNAPKGETVHIVKACTWNGDGFCNSGEVNYKKVKAR